MTSEPPSPDLIQRTTETAARFIQWVATLIRQRNWFMLLVLVGVGLALLGSVFREWINQQLFGGATPAGFWPSVWTAVVLMFAGALAVAIATLPKPAAAPTAADLVERKAIKALRPFGRQDAEVFSQLQRQASLRDSYAAVTADRYRFGILMGASGCGKTSFLQAGLWPRLSGPDCPAQGIYVRFSDRDPLESIRQALASQLDIPADWLSGDQDLVALLQGAEQAAQKPLILLVDQFEQFFAHHPRKLDRQPFIDILCNWYRQPETSRSSLLISIRAELYPELYDLQMALGCALGPQEVIKLDKFHPMEATEVLAVIASTEHLSFDRRFVTELAEQELASREDGLISPVDLQILAWMIERQKGDDLRAFNRSAFQRFGGVEGLLTRFLERTLDARIVPQQRQAAVKVLLALTDLDRQVRSGVLTLAELQTQLQASAKAEEVAEAATWLARGDVRLITPQEKDGIVGYELAHERLIPALMRLAGKELSEADRANRLLEQRVNEWLGNQQSRRYLLRLGELHQIERQRPYLNWGAKRPQKEKLLRLSRRYSYGGPGVVGAMVLVGVLVGGWLMLTPPGQIQQVRWMLAAEAQRYPEPVALAMIKDGQIDRGFAIVADHINSSDPRQKFIHNVAAVATRLSNRTQARDWLTRCLGVANDISDGQTKSEALSDIIAAVGDLGGAPAAAVLKQAIDSAEKIEDAEFKSHALGAIAVAAEGLEDPQVMAVLEQAIDSAEKIEDARFKSLALNYIAFTYSELGDSKTAEKVLEQALDSAEKIEDTRDKSSALSYIAAAYGELGDLRTATSVLEHAMDNAEIIEEAWAVLRDIAAVAGGLGESQAAARVLERTRNSAEKIANTTAQWLVLKSIATAYGELEDSETAVAVLEQATSSAETIEEAWDQSWVLTDIAAAYGTLGKLQATQVMERALNSAESIERPWDKSLALRSIAVTYGKLADPQRAVAVLGQAIDSAETINHAREKSLALRDIAVAYGELGESDATTAVLKQAIDSAEMINDIREKSEVLSAITATVGRLDEPQTTAAVLERAMDNAETMNEAKFKSLSAIAAAADGLGNPQAITALLERTIDSIKTIDDAKSKSEALKAIVRAYANLPRSHTANLSAEIRRIALTARDSDILADLAIQQALRGDWGRALSTLRGISESEKVRALAQVLTYRAENQDLRLIPGAVVMTATALSPSTNSVIELKIFSLDRGCRHHADWWEVLDPNTGELLDRQMIKTPHTDRQPFTLISAPLPVTSDQHLIIRAHMNVEVGHIDERDEFGNPIEHNGYTTQAMQGTISQGFRSVRLSDRFAGWVEGQDPQPEACEAA